MTTVPVRVSVVIPALNEEKNIGTLLDGLASQTTRPDEVIVVDAGSQDGTREEARKRKSRFSRLEILELDGAYPGRARNLGAAVASGEWLLFIDCGFRMGHQCLERLSRRAVESGAPVIFGRVIPNTPNLFTECAAVAYLPPQHLRGQAVLRPTVPTLLIRRETFAGTKGFPEHLRSAEDLLFLKQLESQGIATSFAPEAVAHWQLAPDIKATFRRFRVYSLNNIRAGLARQWQLRIWLYYAFLCLVSVCGILVARQFWVPVLALAAFLSLRSMKSIWQHRHDLRRDFKRCVPRFLGVATIIGIVDLATLAGSCDFILGKSPPRPSP